MSKVKSRRLLSLLLTASMILSCITTAASAINLSDDSEDVPAYSTPASPSTEAETDGTTDADTPAESEDVPTDGTPGTDAPAESEDVPVDGTPSTDVPAESEDVPVDGTPSTDVPAESEDVPVDGTPSTDVPAESEDVPVDGTPSTDVPTESEDVPVDGTPNTDISTETEDVPVDSTPNTDVATEPEDVPNGTDTEKLPAEVEDQPTVFDLDRAAATPNTMILTAPEDVEVILYNTFDYRYFDDAHKVEPTTTSTSDGITSYVFENLPAGNYNYYSSGEGYYTVDKNIWFSEEKAAAGLVVNADPGRLAGNGFEQNPKTSEGFEVVRMQTDEVWEKVFGKTWTDDKDDILTSPYFKNRLENRDPDDRDGLHQQTTNKEMVEWLQDLERNSNDNGYMKIFWYDKEDVAPDHNLYDDYAGAPIVIFTKSDLTSANTLEEAAAILEQNTDKVTIQYQAQVHPPEPAATEGALVMARQLAGSFGDDVLDHVDVVMIPRFNSDGSYEWIRINTQSGLDMNRDYHWLSCPETRMVVNTFNMFYPEVVIDTHELQNQARGIDVADDLQMTGNGGGGLNPPELADLAIEELKYALNNAKENYGIRGTAYGQYPYDVYTTIGAAYPATRGSIGHLIETKGIHAGMSMFERRVMSQWAASSGIIEFAADNSARILDTVAKAREEIIAKGATFEEDDVIVLRHSDVKDQEVYWKDYPVFDMASGVQTGTTDYTWIRRAGIETSRPRPTAYVIPADIDGIDEILRVVDGHAIDYYRLDGGSSVKLNQYIYHDKTNSTLAGENTVTFANGAYVFPMNQTASTLMGLMFEPDIYDNRSYMSDFIRMGYMEATAGEALPLYRYEHDLTNDGKVELVTLAAAGTLTLTAPEDVEVILYNTFDYRSFDDEHKVAPTSASTSNGITSYVFENLPVGNYNYYSSGKGYYTVEKNIWFSGEKAVNGLTVDANPGKLAGSFEQNPETSTNYGIIRLHTDEAWEKVFGQTWSNEDNDLLTSPYFANRDQSNRDGLHQQTTNKEMVEWLQMLEQDQNPHGYMHIFWYDKEDVSPDHHLYDDYPGAPILVFTKSDMSSAKTLEDAAAILKQNTNKVTVQYQAQVHPPEPAATEGALVMARQLANDFGNEVLDQVDVVMIPRFNSDGSYEWVRYNTQSELDMNRDYHWLSCPETRMVVNTFNTFYPEVVIDTHELTNSANGKDTADDLQMTGNGGGGLNPPELADLAIEELEYALKNAKDRYGIRGTAYEQYPYDVYTTIGAAYPATRGSIGHLIETKGISAGMSMFERRVMSQWGASSGIIRFASENSQRILDTVAKARAEIIAKGATFEEEDVIVLRHHDVKDEKPFWEDYPVYDMASGVQTGTTDYTWIRRAGIETSRPRPTAYVIPADTKGIDDILRVVNGHTINYYKLNNGSSVKLSQYVYQDKTNSTLTEEKTVTFANGAYVFPMNQTTSTLMGLMFEPDIYDNWFYSSDFIRMGYMEANAGEALPLYRYEHDLVDGKVDVVTSGSSGSSGGSSGGGGGGGSTSNNFTVSVPSQTSGGTVKVSPSSASKGTKVTITATPSLGYELDKVTVTNSKGEVIEVSSIGNHQYTFIMPESKVTIDATFVRAGASVTPSPETSFTDVPADAYYAAPVAWAVEKGITAGVGTNTFGPNAQCTRAQIMTFLWRAAGSPSASGGSLFTDVSSDAYYASAVQWAVAQGITSGTGPDTFSPNSTCTRAQAVTLIYKALGSPEVSGTNSFTDVDSGAYYANAVQWALSNGVTSGTSDTTFSPNAQCTRAQIVTFLYQAFAN